MLLLFILFMFFALHIQFLLRNVFLGTYQTSYFQFTSLYLFSKDIAVESLLFSIASAASFAAMYVWAYQRTRRLVPVIGSDQATLDNNLGTARKLFIGVGAMQALANVILAVTSNFEYQTMAETLESSGFIFELRVFALAVLAYIALNIRPALFWRAPDYRLVRIILITYSITIFMVQARSRVFELAAILVYAYLMWSGDRVRWRYIGAIALALIIPNLIVLGRLGVPDDPRVLIDGIFSFEYSITLDNFLGAAIEKSYVVQGGLTFLKSLLLLIPSPIRSLMNIDVVKNDAYEALAALAQVRNGGYSMLAEMYQNFGWFSLIAFGFMGFGLGSLNQRASRVGRVTIVAAIAPLIYAAFVVAFRNDFGVFLKFVVQAFIVASILRLFMRTATSNVPFAHLGVAAAAVRDSRSL